MAKRVSVSSLRGALEAKDFDALVRQATLAKNVNGKPRLSDDAIRRSRMFFVDGLSNYEISKSEDVTEQYLGQLVRKVYEIIYSEHQPVQLQVPRSQLPGFLERYKDWIKQ